MKYYRCATCENNQIPMPKICHGCNRGDKYQHRSITVDAYMIEQCKPKIEKVIFNDPATIVYWSDGTKTVVKRQGDDLPDSEKGLAMAICKKVLGNKGNYYKEIKKWL